MMTEKTDLMTWWHGLSKPVLMLWFLALFGIASTGFAIWGVWRVVELSEKYQSKDDQTLLVAVNLKEQIAGYSKLTYDFLLQHDFNRMLLKERQSNRVRDDITQSLGTLAIQSPTGSAGSVIESIRQQVMQFLTLTDKALETAVEEGSALRARGILQDEVEPVLKTAQDTLNGLINGRQKFGGEHFQFIRQQSMMVMFLLIGLAALGMALLLTARIHLIKILKNSNTTPASASVTLPAAVGTDPAPSETFIDEKQAQDRRKILEARSLNTLALINRLNHLHKESEDARKIMAGLLRHTKETENTVVTRTRGEEDLHILQQQSDRIAHAIGRIERVREQSKQFIDNINELMGGIQSLATEGNVIALNVTIELAKLQSQLNAPSGQPQAYPEKGSKISEQIRALATTAAGITGRMAMILSQFRYAHDDFSRHLSDLTAVKGDGNAALGHLREVIHGQQAKNASLIDEKQEYGNSLPLLNDKLNALEEMVRQIQGLAEEEVDDITDTHPARSFKVIPGGAA